MKNIRSIPDVSESYGAGDDGHIYSKTSGQWKPLKPCKDKGGYLMVSVRTETKMQCKKVHRLVCLAFRGKPNDGDVARHMDGNKLNNRPENLRWGTQAENVKDQLRHGTIQRGEKCHKSKLTDEAVIRIRSVKTVASKLAKEYGVHISLIYYVRNRFIWRHLP